MVAAIKPQVSFYTGGPFTAEKLKEILDRVLKANTKQPAIEEIKMLAIALNDLTGAFRFVVDMGNKSNDRADEVSAAIATLITFFGDRRMSCDQLSNAAGSESIIAAEKALYERFQRFLDGMYSHDFQLEMDSGVLMPFVENWRDIADAIAAAFKGAMYPANKKIFGLSNDGPVPRFVAAVIPEITGERPSVGNVGKHLKDVARVRKAKKRHI